ncbi:hypothetical protein Hanom_Chr14g01271511 [Helianthus anomalus]
MNTLPNIHECTQMKKPLFVFVCLTYRTKFLVRVCSFIKWTNINELIAELFTKRSIHLHLYSLLNRWSITQDFIHSYWLNGYLFLRNEPMGTSLVEI